MFRCAARRAPCGRAARTPGSRPGPFGLSSSTPEAEDHAALVLGQNLDRRQAGRSRRSTRPDQQLDHASIMYGSLVPGSTCSSKSSTAQHAHPRAARDGRGRTRIPVSRRARRLRPRETGPASATPISRSSLRAPVTTLLRRARTASESSNTVMSANGSVTASAVAEWMRISGIGLSTSMTAPSTMRDRAARAQHAVRRELRLQHEQRERRGSAAAPSQLIGSTDSAESPAAAGSRRPRRGRSAPARRIRHRSPARRAPAGSARCWGRLMAEMNAFAQGSAGSPQSRHRLRCSVTVLPVEARDRRGHRVAGADRAHPARRIRSDDRPALRAR